MVFIRKALDFVFTQAELKWLDDIMPEVSKREKDDEELKKHEDVSQSCHRKAFYRNCFSAKHIGLPMPCD